MEGPAVRSPWRGGVLDGFWPSSYTQAPKEMSPSHATFFCSVSPRHTSPVRSMACITRIR